MDAKFVNPFVCSVQNVMQTMCGVEVRLGKPFRKTENNPKADVSGIIGFSGDATGSIVLEMSFDIASKLASAFAGTEITPEHEDFADAIGELCNMVAGNAKKEFSEGFDISISLPNVITGKDHAVAVSRSTKHIVIPCETDLGLFHVVIGMVLGKRGTVPQNVATVGAGS